MTTLAIDTSGPTLSLGLFDGAQALAVMREEIGRRHAERLRPVLEELFDAAGLRPSDLTRIGVVRGPGSFTGLRVGLAFARGLALATGAKAVGVSTFEAIAPSVANDDAPFALVLDAKRGEVFAQRFDAHANTHGHPFRHPVESGWPFPDMALAGSGAALVGRDGLDFDPVPGVSVVARLADERDPDRYPPVPLYLRAADAKPQATAVAERQR